MNKLQFITGDWTDRSFYSELAPIITEHNIPIVREVKLPLYELRNPDFWGGLQAIKRQEIASLDDRHWHYDDDIFEEYIQQVASLGLDAVCLFESPFGYERPTQVSWHEFEKKLYERTKIASNILRAKSPGTTIVSPAMGLLDIEFQEQYLQYFVHNRNNFDVYSLHCCCDYKEQTIGLITGFANQVLTTLKKPVWVTRWAVPSCDHPVESKHSLSVMSWKPLSMVTAASKLRKSFIDIEGMCGTDVKWFFSGTCRDAYHPLRKVPGVIWNRYKLFPYSTEEQQWDFFHFIGLVTYNDKIKEPILNTIISLFEESNAG